MTQARDKANIPVLNFASKGIDDNADATAITIDSGEDVGIGNTSPFARLVVQGANNENTMVVNTIGTSPNYIFDVRDDGTSVFRIIGSGNVGIGTTSPARQLTVSGSASPVIAIRDTGTSGSPSLFFGDSGADNVGKIQYNNSNNSLATVVNGSERMRIASNGHIGMGTTTTTYALNIANGAGNMRIKILDSANVANASTSLLEFHGTNNRAGFIGFVGGDMRIDTDTHSAGNIQLGTNGSERMRIDSSGNVLMGKTSSIVANVGHEFNSASYASHTRSGDVALYINRTTNDGTLIEFRQNNSNEGTISVSGSTVSYNGFTGTHWSRFTDNSTPTILRGTVLETLDEMCDWYNLEFDIVTQDEDGNDVTTTEKVPHVLLDTESDGDVITYDHEGTDIQATIVKEADVKHMMSKVSDTTDAKNVYGLFVAYDLDGEGYNDFYVASVGSYVVRIKQGETIAKGDLLQSNGDGTAKVQTDDNIKSSSFAKILSTTIIETYEDGSYLVPCSLNC